MLVDFTLPRCGTMVVHLFYNSKDCILNGCGTGFANKLMKGLDEDVCFIIKQLKA